VVALRFLQRDGQTAAPVLGPDGEHVRVVAEVVVVDADEAEDESRGALVAVHIAERDKAAVVEDGEHELGGDRDVAAPDLLLDRDGERAAGDVGREGDPE